MSDNKLQHIAIIPDGNRTWARGRGLPEILGHTEGVKNIKPIILAAIKAEIQYVTLYALSTENVKERSATELEHIFSLASKMPQYLNLFHENEVHCQSIGNLAALPQKVQEVIQEMADKTKDYKRCTLTLALNYGGRDEIIRAVNRAGTLELTESSLAQYLDTAQLPEVDLVIRTSHSRRLSNFLLWQSAYAELYFTDTLWPAFTPEEFHQAVEWFYAQKRNKGA